MVSAQPEPPAGDGVPAAAIPGAGWGYDAGDVGEFRQGSPTSRWALARYLVGRAIVESVGRTLLLVGLALLVLAAVAEWALGWTVLAVLLVLVVLGVLLLRAALLGLLRRLTAADRLGPIEQRLRGLVRDTRSDVLRELRRLGLPSHMITLPALAVRLAGRRRHETVTALRAFQLDRVVPSGRLDELHLLVREAVGRGRPGTDAGRR